MENSLCVNRRWTASACPHGEGVFPHRAKRGACFRNIKVLRALKMLSVSSGFSRTAREPLQYLRAAALVDLHHIRYKGIGPVRSVSGFYTLGNAFFYAAAFFPCRKACAVVYAAGRIFPRYASACAESGWKRIERAGPLILFAGRSADMPNHGKTFQCAALIEIGHAVRLPAVHPAKARASSRALWSYAVYKHSSASVKACSAASSALCPLVSLPLSSAYSGTSKLSQRQSGSV